MRPKWVAVFVMETVGWKWKAKKQLTTGCDQLQQTQLQLIVLFNLWVNILWKRLPLYSLSQCIAETTRWFQPKFPQVPEHPLEIHALTTIWFWSSQVLWWPFAPLNLFHLFVFLNDARVTDLNRAHGTCVGHQIPRLAFWGHVRAGLRINIQLHLT